MIERMPSVHNQSSPEKHSANPRSTRSRIHKAKFLALGSNAALMGIGGHALKDDIAFHLSNQASTNTTTEESFEANHASESEQLAALGAYIPEENTTSPSHLAPERSPRPLERPERIDE